MNRPRDRASSAGLLPRMEARVWKDGRTVTYRYHAVGEKSPRNFGTDRTEAIRQVLELNGQADDSGTIRRLWEHYKATPAWKGLRDRTRADYEVYSTALLDIFGEAHACAITAPDVAKYLRVERAAAPVRANREIALLGNLIALAIERGEALANPCRGGQVPRNKERPRSDAPDLGEIAKVVEFAQKKGGQWRVITMAAEFAALAGSRQAELLPLHWPQFSTDEVRLRRAKQRAGVEKVERVTVSPALLDLRARLQAVAKDGKVGAVFPNRAGSPYTSSGFAAMWGKLMREAMAGKIIAKRFTFHDLRAHYTTEHKERTGELPNLHQNKATTARVYERSGVSKRNSL